MHGNTEQHKKVLQAIEKATGIKYTHPHPIKNNKINASCCLAKQLGKNPQVVAKAIAAELIAVGISVKGIDVHSLIELS